MVGLVTGGSATTCSSTLMGVGLKTGIEDPGSAVEAPPVGEACIDILDICWDSSSSSDESASLVL